MHIFKSCQKILVLLNCWSVYFLCIPMNKGIVNSELKYWLLKWSSIHISHICSIILKWKNNIFNWPCFHHPLSSIHTNWFSHLSLALDCRLCEMIRNWSFLPLITGSSTGSQNTLENQICMHDLMFRVTSLLPGHTVILFCCSIAIFVPLSTPY